MILSPLNGLYKHNNILDCSVLYYCKLLHPIEITNFVPLELPPSLSKKFNDFVLTKSALRVRTCNIILVQPSEYNINECTVFLSVD